MKTMGRAIGVAVLGIGLVVAPALGQQGGHRGQSRGMGMRGSGPRVEQSVATMLEKREELGLTEDQIRELEAIRAELQEASAPLREEQRAFMQELRAGDVTRNEATASRGDWVERNQAAVAPFQHRVHGVLTEQQQGQLRDLVRSGNQRGAANRGARSERTRQGGARGGGAAMGSAYSDGYRAGMRQSREIRGSRGQAEKGMRERRGRRGAAKPDSTGTGNPS